MSLQQLLFLLLIGCITGGFCAYLAKKRGYTPWPWFIFGMFFGVLGIIFFFFFFPAKSSTHKKPPQEEIPQKKPQLIANQGFWYYLDEAHSQHGPISLDALSVLWQQKKITEETYVWTESMPDWKKVHALESLITLLK